MLARRTPGFSPADIENMLNEAALLAARRNGLKIRMEEIEEAMSGLRKFLFEHVYLNPKAKGEETKAINMISNLFEYYMEHMEALPEEFLKMTEERGESKERIVCDYIAGMTDNYAVKKFQEYFVPESWKF